MRNQLDATRASRKLSASRQAENFRCLGRGRSLVVAHSTKLRIHKVLRCDLQSLVTMLTFYLLIYINIGFLVGYMSEEAGSVRETQGPKL